MPDTVPTRAIVEHRVEISWDGGQSWTRPDRVRREQTWCTARMPNQPGGIVGLRVGATDAGGRVGSQRVVDVYEVSGRDELLARAGAFPACRGSGRHHDVTRPGRRLSMRGGVDE